MKLLLKNISNDIGANLLMFVMQL